MKHLIILTVEGKERHYTRDFFLRHRIDWFEADGEKTKVMLGRTPAGSESPMLTVDHDMDQLLALFSDEDTSDDQQSGLLTLMEAMNNPEEIARFYSR